MTSTIYVGDSLTTLLRLPECSVQCCVTSPPYWGLRDYGVAGQLGMEATPEAYVQAMVDLFREVRRVLTDDGTLWLNLGDSYAANRGGTTPPAETLAGGVNGWTADGDRVNRDRHDGYNLSRDARRIGLKHKDLVGIPWRVALALQADGWYLRQDIIWHKPNPMPESVRDRCTKSHEYLFLLSKSERYFFDGAAIAEPITATTVARLSQPTLADQEGSHRVPGKTNGSMKAVGPRFGGSKYGDSDDQLHATKSGNVYVATGRRNKRSVWTIPTQPFKDAHFAVFPTALVEPCIFAGSRPGDTVLDPFSGSGTTLLVAEQHGRHGLGIELNPDYAEMARKRIANAAPLFTDVHVVSEVSV
jgi:DNA modification methylase